MDVYKDIRRDEYGRVVLFRETVNGHLIEIGEDGYSHYFAATVNGQEYRIYSDEAHNCYRVGIPGTPWAAMRAAAGPRTMTECAQEIYAMAFPESAEN